jgi:hypothetical protein
MPRLRPRALQNIEPALEGCVLHHPSHERAARSWCYVLAEGEGSGRLGPWGGKREAGRSSLCLLCTGLNRAPPRGRHCWLWTVIAWGRSCGRMGTRHAEVRACCLWWLLECVQSAGLGGVRRRGAAGVRALGAAALCVWEKNWSKIASWRCFCVFKIVFLRQTSSCLIY